MKRYLIFLILPLALTARPQGAEERKAKLEAILRTQNLRTPHDGKLIRYLTDPDSVVRARATFAYGSIQDTSVMGLLVTNLTEGDPRTEYNAAFAIGQTAPLLSKRSRSVLEHDLVWARLDRTSAADRLIEELGKFASQEGLNDLILRFGTDFPLEHRQALVRSIGRSAIRGVITGEAVSYLLRFIRSPESAPWEVVYALQRIGNHELIRNDLDEVVLLYRNTDPYARMYLASLLGKIKDDRVSVEPLLKLADFDADWRVRVNALKALGNLDLKTHDEIVESFRRAFSSENMYLALTALSAFGGSALKEESGSAKTKETFALLRRMAANKNNNYLWQLQAEAALALAKLCGRSVLESVRPTPAHIRLLVARRLEAVGETGAAEAAGIFKEYLRGDEPALYRAALEGLRTISQRNPKDSSLLQTSYVACIAALMTNDVSVVTTAASVLGDSLFLRASSVGPLVEKLSGLSIPNDIEAMQEIIGTLGRLGDSRAAEVLKAQLDQPDRSVALAAASALNMITGREYALTRTFEPLLTDFDFKYLAALPEQMRVMIATIRGDIVVELFKDLAPFTVMSFLRLAKERSFFRGVTFHWVVPNFVIQGGDPRGDGWGGPGYTIRSEFSSLTYEAGTVGMASSGKDTEGSQFFITQSPQPHLDGRYTIFGKVVSGMDIVDKIQVDDRIFDVTIVR